MMLWSTIFFAAVAAGLPHEQDAQVPLSQHEVPIGGIKPLTLDGIPLLGFGTWNIGRDNASAAVSGAIQIGYRHIDCAAAYGNEAEVGIGIADGMRKAGLKREDLWITSKLWNDHHDPKLVEPALAATLAHLGLEYLDLYHMHWPVATTKSGGNAISYHSTWKAMGSLLDKGRVRYLGVSNFSPYQLEDLMNRSSIAPAVHQMEMHPYLQQNDWLKKHEKLGIHVTAYSPLAGSNPTYDPGDPPSLLNESKVIRKIAKKRNCTPAQVVLQWGMSRGTSVIPKSAHLDRIEENFQSSTCALKTKDLKKIDKLGKYRQRYSNPSKRWKVDLFEGLEDAKGKHKHHS